VITCRKALEKPRKLGIYFLSLWPLCIISINCIYCLCCHLICVLFVFAGVLFMVVHSTAVVTVAISWQNFVNSLHCRNNLLHFSYTSSVDREHLKLLEVTFKCAVFMKRLLAFANRFVHFGSWIAWSSLEYKRQIYTKQLMMQKCVWFGWT